VEAWHNGGGYSNEPVASGMDLENAPETAPAPSLASLTEEVARLKEALLEARNDIAFLRDGDEGVISMLAYYDSALGVQAGNLESPDPEGVEA
jgi:hypothetical protein